VRKEPIVIIQGLSHNEKGLFFNLKQKMYYNEKSEIYLNGKWLNAAKATTNPFSQTLHYGNGVFEGMRSYKTENGAQIFKAREHFERLKYSAESMHIPFEWKVDELTKLCYELLEKNELEDAYIRPLIWLGENMKLEPTQESFLFLSAWEWPKYLGDNLLSLMTSSYERPNPKSCHVDAKVTGHYTNSILATTEAKQKGYDEALLFDNNGYVAEGPGANFFIEKNGILYTPPQGNILPGITRQTILELAIDAGFTAKEELFGEEWLLEADSAFFTGTAAEVAGIQSINNIDMKLNWDDSMGHTLAAMYRKHVRGNEYKYFTLV